jgi:hypothetical protein
MTYFIPNTNNEYVIDDNGVVFSLKANKILKPYRDFIHLSVNGFKIVDKIDKFLSEARLYNIIHSNTNIKDMCHIYVFDYSMSAIFHGTIPVDYDDETLHKFLKSNGLKDSQISYMITDSKLNILEL